MNLRLKDFHCTWVQLNCTSIINLKVFFNYFISKSTQKYVNSISQLIYFPHIFLKHKVGLSIFILANLYQLRNKWFLSYIIFFSVFLLFVTIVFVKIVLYDHSNILQEGIDTLSVMSSFLYGHASFTKCHVFILLHSFLKLNARTMVVQNIEETMLYDVGRLIVDSCFVECADFDSSPERWKEKKEIRHLYVTIF